MQTVAPVDGHSKQDENGLVFVIDFQYEYLGSLVVPRRVVDAEQVLESAARTAPTPSPSGPALCRSSLAMARTSPENNNCRVTPNDWENRRLAVYAGPAGAEEPWMEHHKRDLERVVRVGE